MRRMADWMRGSEVTAFFWVNRAWKCSFTDKVMPVLTHLGGAICSIGLSLFLLAKGNTFWHQIGVHLALSLFTSHVVVAVCKKIVPRQRPYQVLDDVFTGRKVLKDASFPSGHATAAFCTATVLSFALPTLSLLFYSLAFLVALSRVFLGLHYPSDIAIGAVLGTATAWLLA